MARRIDWLAHEMPLADVKRRSVRGVVASAARRVLDQGIGIVSLVVLARLLTPADIGLVALVATLTAIAAVIAELQLAVATVKFQQLSQPQASNLFWLRLGTTAAAAVLVLLALPLIESVFGDPRIGPVTLALAPGMLLGALGAQHAALLRRNLRVIEQARVEVYSAAVTAGISILGAMHGWTYWALVAGQLGGGLTRTTQLWSLCSWRPSAPSREATMRPLIAYGLRVSVFSVLSVMANSLGKLVIGQNWGAGATGHYSRASAMHGMMLSNLWDPLGAVVGPALAKLSSNPRRMATFYYRASALLTIGAMPMAFVGTVLPQELVGILLGPQWDRSAVMLFWLSLGVLPTVVCHTTSWVFFSVGEGTAILRWGVIGWSTLMLGIFVGSRFSAEGVAMATSATALLLTVPCLRTAFRGTPMTIGGLCRALWPPVAAGVIAGALAWACLEQLGLEHSLLRLMAGCAVFGLVYAALLLTVFRQLEVLADIWSQLVERRRAPRPARVIAREPVGAPLTTPVAFFVFNRPEPSARVLEAIAHARPERLLVVADGPRPDHATDADRCRQVRALLDRVDWPCRVETQFADSNLGCKRRVASGLDWGFRRADEAIILEDDCLPEPSFFRFCGEMLERYRHDERVHMVRGSNFQDGRRFGEASYYFSRFCNVWGWAGWARAWRYYDVEMRQWPTLRDSGWLDQRLPEPVMADLVRQLFDGTHAGRIDTWDYQWTLATWLRDALAIVPQANLVANIGYDEAGTHERDQRHHLAELVTAPLEFPLRHPGVVAAHAEADLREWSMVYPKHRPNRWRRTRAARGST